MKFKDWFRVNWLTEAFNTNNMKLIKGNIYYLSTGNMKYIFRHDRMEGDDIYSISNLYLRNMSLADGGNIYFHVISDEDIIREATHEEKRLLISEETGVGLYYSVDAHSIF
jgi:hypothetical protein